MGVYGIRFWRGNDLVSARVGDTLSPTYGAVSNELVKSIAETATGYQIETSRGGASKQYQIHKDFVIRVEADTEAAPRFSLTYGSVR